ncbi:mitochondrial uncoupling protein 3-like [Asterias rubens]|uniref:mitochondrial uncoupling protein 3-like n=1 Tax=Asterias rubens TaxID=7604 RepID=UPI0014558029|nr:mitochondrial uncoupling protein 3-like [Asterias rubens]XP_033629477.1 mitochondrial uncoupling protein 3-like [Asterias rubens]
MVGFAPTDIPPTIGMKLFSAGLAACIADAGTFPLDTAKVRLQIQGESSSAQSKSFSFAKAKSERSHFKYRGIFGTISTIIRQEGPRSLYNGLVAGLQRQMCFASIRIGLYDSVKQVYSGYTGTNIMTKILAGITTGAMAVSFAQPTDVVKVRMQAQTNIDPTKPKRYTGAMHAYRTIARDEGMRGLWKGTMPNVTRNAVVNASELVAYDMIKERILRTGLMADMFPLHFVSAFGAGFVATCCVSPVDVVKTRYMNSPPGQYKGAIDVAVKMFREGGPVAFYKGFMPNFVRLGSWNVAMFVCYEQLKRVCVNVVNNN